GFAGTLLLVALATLANPYGWRLHTHVRAYLGDRFLADNIVEYLSPDFHNPTFFAFEALVLLLVALPLLTGRRLDPTYVLLALASVTALALDGGTLLGVPLLSARFPEDHFPVAAIDALGADIVAARTFHSDLWGGYLIYRLGPRGAKVFVDGRSDFYGSEFL